MAENLFFEKNAPRSQIYEAIVPQIAALNQGEPDLIAKLANTAAALKEAFDFFWVGFYIVKGEELVLGPFQGPLACTRIRKGKGVCGTAWKEGHTILVPDVNAFPGHIACSSASLSEIVVPLIRNGEVVAVLDVDSDKLADFSGVDRVGLEKICEEFPWM